MSGISLGIAVLAQSPASITVYFYPEHFYLAADEVQSGYAVEIVWYWDSVLRDTELSEGYLRVPIVCPGNPFAKNSPEHCEAKNFAIQHDQSKGKGCQGCSII